jgi:hypothetical protein
MTGQACCGSDRDVSCSLIMASGDGGTLRLETEGWSEVLERLTFPPEVPRLLPSVCDRFEEAKHFLLLTSDLAADIANVQRANWYAGAHISAVIAIDDAVKADYGRGRKRLQDSALKREFYLRPGSEIAEDRDPVGINRAYRELRNLRVHYGERVVEPHARLTAVDLPSQPAEPPPPEPPPRWFLRPLERPAVDHLDAHSSQARKEPLLSPEQRARFNEFIRMRPFSRVAAQHLYVLGRSILEDYESFASSEPSQSGS